MNERTIGRGREQFPDPTQPIGEKLYTFEKVGRYEYSLVLVTSDMAFKLNYEKPCLGLNVDFTPMRNDRWSVRGVVDADTVQNMGIRISQPRRGNTPPQLNESDRRRTNLYFGALDQVSESLWDFHGILPLQNMYTFLDAVWRPQTNLPITWSEMPKFHLGKPDIDYRILPEKIPYKPILKGSRGTSSLKVVTL